MNLYQKFLTRYPLLWNTRAFVMVPVLLALHLLYFASGYLSAVNAKSNEWYELFYPSGDLAAFSVLLSVLTLVLWLVFYLRNNAFRDLYPLRRGHLSAEFLLGLLIVFMAISFPLTNQYGKQTALSGKIHRVDLAREVNTINMAHVFLPWSFSSYEPNDICASAPPVVAAGDTAQPLYSYLNYHSLRIYSNREKVADACEQAATARRWLTEGKKDSVARVLHDYLALVTKYGGSYNLDVEKHVDRIFATPDFRVDRLLGAEPDFSISGSEAESTLENLLMVDRRLGDNDLMLVLMYLAVCLQLLLFSFRLIRLRTWFIALLVLGIYLVLFGVLMGIGFYRQEEMAGSLFIVVSLGALVAAVINIGRKQSKLVSGICLLFFMWTLPSLLPITVAMNDSHTERVIDWEWLSFVNIMLIILVTLFLLTPLARQWQANPEE